MSDIIYGDVPLPDGRICKATLKGCYYSRTWDDPSSFEINEKDPLEVVWIADTNFTDADYNEFQDFIMNYLLEHGEMELNPPEQEVYYDGGNWVI